MTPSDVLVAAPWIVFGVALAVMCTLLRRSQHRNGRQPRRSDPPAADTDGHRPGRACAGRGAAGAASRPRRDAR